MLVPLSEVAILLNHQATAPKDCGKVVVFILPRNKFLIPLWQNNLI